MFYLEIERSTYCFITLYFIPLSTPESFTKIIRLLDYSSLFHSYTKEMLVLKPIKTINTPSILATKYSNKPILDNQLSILALYDRHKYQLLSYIQLE